MSFIALDDKSECYGYYCDGELHIDKLPPKELTKTWRYLPFMHGEDRKYANLYCGGKNLSSVCPEDFKETWEYYKKRFHAYLNSFREAKISLKENCFYDLVPEQFLLEFFDAQCKIVDHVFDTYDEPDNYEFMFNLEQLLVDIKNRKLNINKNNIKNKMYEKMAREFIRKMGSESNKYIRYEQFGTKTGRLHTKNGFPILNMKKEYRAVIEPQNDFFLEMDYNAAELRVFLALLNKDQPEGDIHDWNSKRLGISREEAKTDLFAWLYGSTKIDENKYKKLYDSEAVRRAFWDGVVVTNPYGRKIESDAHHALSYIVQSTTSDLFLRQVVKINKLLENRQSFIAFMVHDSVVLDMSHEDKDIIKQIQETFSNTEYGSFLSSLKIGKNYGTMNEVKI